MCAKIFGIVPSTIKNWLRNFPVNLYRRFWRKLWWNKLTCIRRISGIQQSRDISWGVVNVVFSWDGRRQPGGIFLIGVVQVNGWQNGRVKWCLVRTCWDGNGGTVSLGRSFCQQTVHPVGVSLAVFLADVERSPFDRQTFTWKIVSFHYCQMPPFYSSLWLYNNRNSHLEE